MKHVSQEVSESFTIDGSVSTTDDVSADSPTTQNFDNNFDDDAESSEQRQQVAGKQRESTYKTLLDIYADDLAQPRVELFHTPEQPVQIGMTVWSARERDLLFTALSRRNRNNIRGISEAIGTKSEPEVHTYLHLFEQTLKTYPSRGAPDQLINLADIPATTEVSDECFTALESAADAALTEERSVDEKLERAAYGESWILDSTFVHNHVIEAYTSPSVDKEHQLQRSLELLDLGNFLELSERIFMNSCHPEQNWRTYINHDFACRSPAIYNSAFVELHSLVVELTRRLISSAIFYAMSRRQVKTRHNIVKQVRRQDVLTALDVLGLKHDATEFWCATARRCNLEVYEELRAKKCMGKYNYDDLEKVLKHTLTTKSDVVSPDLQEDGITEHCRSFSIAGNAQPSPAKRHELSGASGDAVIGDLANSIYSASTEDSEKEEDIYLEALDQQASQVEEQNLWALLGKRQRVNENASLPKRPRLRYLWGIGHGDWRDGMEYRTAWQSFSTPVPEFDSIDKPPQEFSEPEEAVHMTRISKNKRQETIIQARNRRSPTRDSNKDEGIGYPPDASSQILKREVTALYKWG